MVVDNANFLYLGGHNQFTNTTFINLTQNFRNLLMSVLSSRHTCGVGGGPLLRRFGCSGMIRRHLREWDWEMGMHAAAWSIALKSVLKILKWFSFYLSSGHTPGSRATHRCCDNAASERAKKAA